MSTTFPTQSRQILSARQAAGSAGALDPEILSYLAARAEARGTSLNDLVNKLLRKDIELIEAAR